MYETQIVNDEKTKKPINVIDNDNYNVPNKYERSRKIDYIADQLVEKLGNQQYRGFYCKVALKLSESRIWNNYETAKKAASAKGQQPGKLFTYLCKKDGV